MAMNLVSFAALVVGRSGHDKLLSTELPPDFTGDRVDYQMVNTIRYTEASGSVSRNVTCRRSGFEPVRLGRRAP